MYLYYFVIISRSALYLLTCSCIGLQMLVSSILTIVSLRVTSLLCCGQFLVLITFSGVSKTIYLITFFTVSLIFHNIVYYSILLLLMAKGTWLYICFLQLQTVVWAQQGCTYPSMASGGFKLVIFLLCLIAWSNATFTLIIWVVW